MAAIGSLEQICSGAPENIRPVLLAYTREWARSLRFGAPDDDDESPVRGENFGGALVPMRTSGTTNAEVAVAHDLARTPRLAIPVLNLGTVGSKTPVLTVTQPADATYLYLASDETNVLVLLYVE